MLAILIEAPLDELDTAIADTQALMARASELEASITLKTSGKSTAPYVTCLVRGKPIKLTPEEAIRQLYILVLRKVDVIASAISSSRTMARPRAS